MTPADYDRFTTVLRAFAELKSRTLSAPAIELYWRSMQAWSLADFEAAATQLVRTCKFFPTPSEFEDLRHAGQPTSGEMWARALAHVRTLPVRGGMLQELPSGDPVLDATARACGGWRVLASGDVVSLQFIEKRFCEHLETLRQAEDTRAALPQLTGGATLPRLEVADGRPGAMTRLLGELAEKSLSRQP